MLVSRSAPAVIDDDQANFVTAEFSRVCQDPVDGVYICPLLNNILEWRGFIMVRTGCYSGGTFRFTLNLPQGFPQSIQLPTVVFDSFLFHPYIDPATRELCLQACFPGGVWRRDQHKVIDVLLYLQEAFAILTEKFPLDSRSIVNKQAANFFIKDFDNYRLRAEELVSLSRHTVYDVPEDCCDPHLIVFPPWESSKLEPIRRQLVGKTGPSTNSTSSSSRTASDFSSKTNSNGADADDERASIGSGHSFEEINLVEGRNFHQRQFSDELSSVDLGSYPPSGRIGKIIEEDTEEIETGFDLLNFEDSENFEKHIPDEYSNDEKSTKPVSFKLGCTSSSSGNEYQDETEPHSMHLKSSICNSVSVEHISESENDAALDEASTKTPRGADTRSVSVFSNVLK